MASFNKVILAGNLTRDPELRYTPKGSAVVKIGLAVNRTWKNEAGETKEEVTFIEIEAWGRQAEVIAQYMRKGRPLLVEGRLKLDTWEDKNTHQKQSKLKVVLESFHRFVALGHSPQKCNRFLLAQMAWPARPKSRVCDSHPLRANIAKGKCV